jgi:GAF domain-containing protein
MTERETVDTFARQVAQVLRRLEAERQNGKLNEGEECATPPTCG